MNRLSKSPLNYLLVMPRLVECIGDGYVFPLGMSYISASMKAEGFKVYTVNLSHKHEDPYDVLKELIQRYNIHVVGTGGLSPQYHMVKNVIQSVKEIDPNIITIVGNSIISADPEIGMEALEYADYGVIGEGEITMNELCHSIEEGGDISKIKGIIYKADSAYIKNAARTDTVDVDKLPWSDYDGFDIEKYLDCPPAGFAGLSKGRQLPMLSSRSCPYRCTFCYHPHGNKFRERNLDDFFAEMTHLQNKYDIKYISMADELWSPVVKRATEFCIKMKDQNISWYADMRVDRIKPELIPHLKASGLDVVFFGLESADNKVLKSMKKNITIEKTEASLKNVYDAGIAAYGCFIFGDIAETYESAQKTIQWWKDHQQYNVHMTLIKPYPGTAIYKHCVQNGIIKDPIKYLKDGCPQINISKMGENQFSDIIKQISALQDAKAPIEVELLDLDAKTGRETVRGVCQKCSHVNTWEQIKLFAIDNIHCSNCSQKYEIPVPTILRKNLERNVNLLLEKYGKVGIWGMTLSIMGLFKQKGSPLNNDNVFAVDIAESKQNTVVNEKQVHHPSIIDKEKITAVIAAVPSHVSAIKCQAEENHSTVKEVFDIGQLVLPTPIIGPDYFPVRSLNADVKVLEKIKQK